MMNLLLVENTLESHIIVEVYCFVKTWQIKHKSYARNNFVAEMLRLKLDLVDSNLKHYLLK